MIYLNKKVNKRLLLTYVFHNDSYELINNDNDIFGIKNNNKPGDINDELVNNND